MNTIPAISRNHIAPYVQGFSVYNLTSEEVELAVVPELGAKIISLKDRRTGREWLWHPKAGFKLFKNKLHDDFAVSPLVGVDECLPTIQPCHWNGRALPDHGEVWSAAWEVDAGAWKSGRLQTTVRLKISPLALTRTIELAGNEIGIRYELRNLSTTEENFIWAIHPLLRLQAGDELELPDSTRSLMNGANWVDAVASAVPPQKSAKIFARPVNEGRVAIDNAASGDRLEFAWDTAENDTLGLWLTRGGWHGHDHFAIEPANAPGDSLALMADGKHCGTVAGNSAVSWQLFIRVGR